MRKIAISWHRLLIYLCACFVLLSLNILYVNASFVDLNAYGQSSANLGDGPYFKKLSEPFLFTIDIPAKLPRSQLTTVPALLPGGRRGVFFASTDSILCKSSDSPIKKQLPAERPWQLKSKLCGVLPKQMIFSAHIIETEASPVLVEVMQAVTQNAKQKTSYISVSTLPYNSDSRYGLVQSPEQIRAAVWPSSGAVSSQWMHPSSIVWKKRLYIFYAEGDAKSSALQLAAAYLDEGKLGEFHIFNSSTSAFDIPALPKTFDNKSPEKSLGQIRILSQAKGIFSEDSDALQTLRFAVAQDEVTGAFIGVELYKEIGKEGQHLALRSSSDLIHWSKRSVMNVDANLFEEVNFANSEFSSNTEINSKGFYLVGLSSGFNLRAIKLSVSP